MRLTLNRAAYSIQVVVDLSYSVREAQFFISIFLSDDNLEIIGVVIHCGTRNVIIKQGYAFDIAELQFLNDIIQECRTSCDAEAKLKDGGINWDFTQQCYHFRRSVWVTIHLSHQKLKNYIQSRRKCSFLLGNSYCNNLGKQTNVNCRRSIALVHLFKTIDQLYPRRTFMIKIIGIIIAAHQKTLKSNLTQQFHLNCIHHHQSIQVIVPRDFLGLFLKKSAPNYSIDSKTFWPPLSEDEAEQLRPVAFHLNWKRSSCIETMKAHAYLTPCRATFESSTRRLINHFFADCNCSIFYNVGLLFSSKIVLVQYKM